MRWGVVDVACVVVFVAIGRANHGEADSASGFLETAWPFLLALVIGWVVVRAWRRPTGVVPVGLGVWVVTVAGGMVLRALSGQGTAFAFVIVATVFLGVTLLGWRALARLRRPR